MTKRIEWKTKLQTEAQDLLAKHEQELIDGRYRDTSVKDVVDLLTVAKCREIVSELEEELTRLSTMKERVVQLKEKIKEVSGI